MPVHPIEFRYRYPEMYAVFTEEAKLQSWLDVEVALAWAHAELGTIPKAAAKEIEKKAKVEVVKVERVKEIEEKTKHDLLAMVYALQEVCEGNAGGYIHLGATSYDTEDTALALQLRMAMDIIESDLKSLLRVLLDKGLEHRETVCIGRTHGQHALPMTYGMKFALWAAEVGRHLDRLSETRRRVEVGKMNGAVGTMASFGKKGFEVQRITMERLKLEPALVTNQIVQRDRHAELQCLLALIAGTLDKMGREIRNLQRTEIAEVSEPARSPSSTMPQKLNPSNTERICGLARVIRGSVNASLESIALEHERDISNSGVERINIPEGFILTDYILRQMTGIVKGLSIDSENIERNLNMTLGLILTERVMIELVAKGIGRQEGHELMRRLALKAWKEKRPLRQVMEDDEEAMRLIPPADMDEWLNPHNYIGTSVEQVDRAIDKLKEKL
ncbi:adenylosuccinate lyase [Candidatus Bathyarchaeota archaeon RBG_13_52_12]|nr:MAG: adenylosuccinate lyase [Candidatus Bathyarchaeota archaeon RBG_13_52_12]